MGDNKFLQKGMQGHAKGNVKNGKSMKFRQRIKCMFNILETKNMLTSDDTTATKEHVCIKDACDATR